MQRPHIFTWNEKHLLLAFCINVVQLLGLFTLVSPWQFCQRCMCLQATDLQWWGRCEAGDEQQLGALRHGLWVRVRMSGAQLMCPNHTRDRSAASGVARDRAGTWGIFTGSLCRAGVQHPKQIHVWRRCEEGSMFRKNLLFRESLSAWAVHQLPHELLYLLLLTTRFSQALDVMKTGWSTTFWQFHLFLLFSRKPKQQAAVAFSAAW